MKWDMVNLGSLCKIVTGKLDANAANEDGKYPFFTCAITPLKINTHAFDCEAILIAGNGDLNAKHYTGKFNVYQRTYILSDFTEDIYPRFCFLFIDRYLETLRKQSIGGVIKYIKLGMLTNAQIPLPSFAEQKRIATILDKAESIRQQRQESLGLMDTFIKCVFLEMFGDPVTNPMGWDIEKLSSYIAIQGGFAFQSKGFTTTGIPVLKIGNINTGVFRDNNLVFWPHDTSLERYMLYSSDVVISLTGTVGKDDYGNICILGNEYESYYLNQRNAKLIFKENMNKYFLAHLLKTPQVKKQLTGVSRGVRQANISNNDILQLSLPIPPIELQNKFADIVHKVETQKENMRQQLREAEDTFKALQQQFFG